ncbi:MAG: hypothetical protein Fur0042_05560 [Cyanophyceae cyanobacterium]
MGWQSITYDAARDKMQPGDIIAFSSNQGLSRVIKWATRSDVTHVGIVFQTKVFLYGEAQEGILNQVMEATVVSGASGGGAVISNRLSTRLKFYPGVLWWLPLRDDLRQRTDLRALYNFLLRQEHYPYDIQQAVFSALDLPVTFHLFSRLLTTAEDSSKMFCSELAAGALKAGGTIKNINPSEVTPIDLCRFELYQSDYYQLKGPRMEIEGFNSRSPEGWGLGSYG